MCSLGSHTHVGTCWVSKGVLGAAAPDGGVEDVEDEGAEFGSQSDEVGKRCVAARTLRSHVYCSVCTGMEGVNPCIVALLCTAMPGLISCRSL